MFEADLQTAANIAEIIGALLVVAGVFFALAEIRHLRQQRQENAAMEIMRSFQSPEFTKALRLVMDFEKECRHCHEETIPQELQDAARIRYPGILEDGRRRVLAGETSMEEVLRVTNTN